MFDNHSAPSIPPRATPHEALPLNLGRTVAVAALLGLPLMLAASLGAASLPMALLLGLGQTALLTLVILLASGLTRPPHARAGAPIHPRPRHG